MKKKVFCTVGEVRDKIIKFLESMGGRPVSFEELQNGLKESFEISPGEWCIFIKELNNDYTIRTCFKMERIFRKDAYVECPVIDRIILNPKK